MFDDVEIVVDLQTGTISVLLPAQAGEERIELEAVSANDEFAPRE